MKKVLTLILSLSLILFTFPVSTNALASSEPAPPSISEKFMKVCDLFFSGNGQAYDQNNEDITSFFYNTYLPSYDVGDYVAIYNGYLNHNLSSIQVHEISIKPAGLVLNHSYEEMSYHLVKQNGFPYNGKTWEFLVFAKGTFSYYDSSFQIVDFKNPTITFDFNGLGVLFSGSVTNVTLSPITFTNNNKTAVFTVTTKHEVSCPVPEYITGTLGPFTNVSVFNISY